MQILHDPAEAEDACQEVFLRMHRSFDSFDPTRTLKPWVGKITYNVCLRRREGVIRKATFAVSPEQLNERHPGADENPEAHARKGEAGQYLEQALSALSAEDRALLTLRYREGLSDSEVAEASEMRVNTVKTRIFRARAQLKQSLRRLLRGESL